MPCYGLAPPSTVRCIVGGSNENLGRAPLIGEWLDGGARGRQKHKMCPEYGEAFRESAQARGAREWHAEKNVSLTRGHDTMGLARCGYTCMRYEVYAYIRVYTPRACAARMRQTPWLGCRICFDGHACRSGQTTTPAATPLFPSSVARPASASHVRPHGQITASRRTKGYANVNNASGK